MSKPAAKVVYPVDAETLRLRYDDKSVTPPEVQYPGSSAIFRHWQPALDQAKELLTEMGKVMAELIRG